ncbi:hypothetical protein AUJ66_02390 [Candidatus Desantisbacteria bacterium CG1_02_38_46]|uniref:NADH:quinone oxidoreductase/Mrp antiporter membrane subunit domain-containing protein n=1 Tax=Candidatus Desantisbacteria bacterium CG1_02_38_46 TaxID=1817893 RepID=A0A1J4SEL7_9BACT|nr:MAG: hypothetical protein AUJ66_02390 [Candidatus Desantisbacteria bacterium CG1_02_38_46]
MIILVYSIFLPVLGGLICLLIPNRVKILKEAIALIVSFVALVIGITIFKEKGAVFYRELGLLTQILGINLDLRVDYLNSFILMFITFFGFLITLYSLKFMSGKNRLNEYYAYLLINIGVANGAVLSNNLLTLLIFWDLVLICLYGMISIGGGKAASCSARKSFIIVGVADFLLLLGILLVWYMTRTFSIDVIKATLFTSVSFKISALAFICMACGALAKAGSMPFHTWIPDAATEAPVPVMAFLPASLDKLLGIYLLIRITSDLFIMPSWLGMILMFIGAFTIIAAVMMALIQHDLKKLLSYHAVSQVGYMVLGIGTGNPIGIAGGLFHMLNHAIYKSCLFLGGGAVEHQAGTTDLEKLGGLSRVMPITFVATLIAAFSISGVPPFNGFISKWMVYQGVIQSASSQVNQLTSFFCWIFLVAAMFGSALTLASFMKLIHSTFFGQPVNESPTTTASAGRESSTPIKEVNWTMWVPMAVLAALCVIFGVFAQIPLGKFIGPAIGLDFARIPRALSLSGLWSPTLATGLIVIGLIIGYLIYIIGKATKPRVDSIYIGGEVATEVHRFPGTQFYNTVKEIGGLSGIYKAAEKKFLDFYKWGMGFLKGVAYILFYCIDRFVDWLVLGVARLVLLFSWILRRGHIGALPTYLAWCLIGFGIILYVLVR